MEKKKSKSRSSFLLEKKVRRTIREYGLFTHKDKIGVAVSGGKDSSALLSILKKLNYNIMALTINSHIPNYNAKNLRILTKVTKEQNIPLKIYSFKEEFGYTLAQIQKRLNSKGYDYQSCMICGILKRHIMNKYSKKLRLDAVATGHNLDDAAQTTLMNVFRNDFNLSLRQKPISGVIKTKSFVRRVKPLFFVPEADLKRYCKDNKLEVNFDTCPSSGGAFRGIFKSMLNKFEKDHPSVKHNIVKYQQTMIKNVKTQEYGEIETCTNCDEPSSTKLCKACTLIDKLKN